jgi:DNA modification methylase
MQKLMNGETAKLVFTSPPYNMGADMYQHYDDNMKSEEYIKFNLQVINVVRNFLRGFVFWNISYNKKSRFDFIEIMYKITKETGLNFLELIVWNKGHGMPITSKDMMTRQYEDILVVGDEENIQLDMELFYVGGSDKRLWFNKINKQALTNFGISQPAIRS